MAEPRICVSCGKPLKEEGDFCIYCGAKAAPAAPVPDAAANAANEETMRLIFGAQPEEAAPAAVPEEEAPFTPRRSAEYEELMEKTYAPMGAWNICGTLLLFSLPVIGFIFALVFACGGCRKKQKKRLAQGYLLFLLVSVILCAVLCTVLALFYWAPIMDEIEKAVPAETWDYLTGILPFLTA